MCLHESRGSDGHFCRDVSCSNPIQARMVVQERDPRNTEPTKLPLSHPLHWPQRIHFSAPFCSAITSSVSSATGLEVDARPPVEYLVFN